MSNSLYHKNVSCLAVAGTATLVSPATCWRGSLASLLATRVVSLHLSRELYKSNLFMQNKAKLQNDEMNITSLLAKSSENFRNFCRQKNKAKQTQNKANLQNDEMNVIPLLTREYENFRTFDLRKNKAKQTQNEPNFDPILALFSPILASVSPMMTINCWRMNERSLNEDN